jgi:hypothetical protein
MVRKFEITNRQTAYDSYMKCWICNKGFEKDGLFVKYAHGKYHLSCFKRYGDKLIKRWNMFKNNMQENINKLEPYKKEMICENLEGLGQKKND